MLDRNLLPGQWQIGDFVFGAHTMFTVEDNDVGAYEINVQDYQQAQSDETHFGMDTLKPMPITLTINALHNYALPNIVGLMPYTQPGMKPWAPVVAAMNFENDRRPGAFAKEWRADEVRHAWGELKPLKYCRPEDGTTVRIYGRPGKLAVVPLGQAPNNQSQQLVAEYRRSDTLYYSDFEWVTSARPNEIMNIARIADNKMGDAPSWLRLLLIGPMTRPIIQLGFVTVELDATIPVGRMVEISSYPWARRVITDDGLSLNNRLVQPYLDKLLFQTNSLVEFSWNATGLKLGGDVDDVNFENYDPAAFYAGWNISYMGPGGGQIIPRLIIVLPGFPNILRVCLTWNDEGVSFALGRWRLGIAIRKRKLATDWQRIGFRMALPAESSLIEEECTNRIIGRSNESGTRYSYWDITYTRCWFGVHIDGTDHILTGHFGINRLVWQLNKFVQNFNALFGNGQHGGPGWDYDAEFGTGTDLFMHTLWINGYRVAAFRQPESAGFIGRDYRFPGLGMKATQRFMGQSTPGPLSNFRARDNWPPELEDEVQQQIKDEYEERFGSIEFSKVYLFWRDAWMTI